MASHLPVVISYLHTNGKWRLDFFKTKREAIEAIERLKLQDAQILKFGKEI